MSQQAGGAHEFREGAKRRRSDYYAASMRNLLPRLVSNAAVATVAACFLGWTWALAWSLSCGRTSGPRPSRWAWPPATRTPAGRASPATPSRPAASGQGDPVGDEVIAPLWRHGNDVPAPSPSSPSSWSSTCVLLQYCADPEALPPAAVALHPGPGLPWPGPLASGRLVVADLDLDRGRRGQPGQLAFPLAPPARPVALGAAQGRKQADGELAAESANAAGVDLPAATMSHEDPYAAERGAGHGRGHGETTELSEPPACDRPERHPSPLRRRPCWRSSTMCWTSPKIEGRQASSWSSWSSSWPRWRLASLFGLHRARQQRRARRPPWTSKSARGQLHGATRRAASRQILYNLISNALRSSPSRARSASTARRGLARCLELSVQRHRRRHPAEKASAKLFAKFDQLDSSSHAPLRRHGPRPGDLSRARSDDARRDRRRPGEAGPRCSTFTLYACPCSGWARRRRSRTAS